MRIFRFPKLGKLEDLTLVEQSVPKPAAGQVLVRMRAASLNYRDHLIATGNYGIGPSPENLIPLSDGAGEVVELGQDVKRWKAGDRVASTFFETWIRGEAQPEDFMTALGGAVDGVLAEYRIFDEDALVRVPDNLSYEEAASLPCAGVTVWNALFTQRPLRAGETVLTLGTGGVSMFALQLAKAAGARVLITSSSDEKLERAKQLGAWGTINYKTHPEWDKEVLKLTRGRGVDHVVEVGGPGTLQRSLNAVRIGGYVYLVGVLTMGEINPLPILGKNATVRGIYVGSRDMFEAMNSAIAVNGIQPVIDRVFPFEETKDAYRYLVSGSHMGKIVIRFP
jgi:NADPH:quinone reductase-like Zn-dependent oxidoreductase